jgi:hypothetical protein
VLAAQASSLVASLGEITQILRKRPDKTGAKGKWPVEFEG